MFVLVGHFGVKMGRWYLAKDSKVLSCSFPLRKFPVAASLLPVSFLIIYFFFPPPSFHYGAI